MYRASRVEVPLISVLKVTVRAPEHPSTGGATDPKRSGGDARLGRQTICLGQRDIPGEPSQLALHGFD